MFGATPTCAYRSRYTHLRNSLTLLVAVGVADLVFRKAVLLQIVRAAGSYPGARRRDRSGE